MLSRLFNSSTFRKTFILYSSILLIPVIFYSISNFQRKMVEDRKKAFETYAADAGRILEAIDGKLLELKDIGETIGNEVWVRKLMVDADIYDNEYGKARNTEIIESLANTVCRPGILSFGGVIYPQKNIIITHWGTYDIKDFFKSIAVFSDQSLNELYAGINEINIFKIAKPSIIALWGNQKRSIPVLQSLEIVNRPRAVLILFIDSSYLASFIGRIEGTGPVSISISDDSCEVYSQNTTGSHISFKNSRKLENFTLDSRVCNWKYSISYPGRTGIIDIKSVTNIFAAAVLTSFIGVVLAFLFAMISYKPLYALSNKIMGTIKSEQVRNKLDKISEYDIIEKSFNMIVNENTSLHQALNDYKSSAKGNMLLKLLKGYFKDEQQIDRLKELGLDYTDGMYYCTLLINFDFPNNPLDAETRERIEITILMSVKKVMAQYNMEYQLFEVQNACNAILVSSDVQFHEEEITKVIVPELMKEIEKNCNITPDMLYGSIEKGLLGISKSYYEANEKLQYEIFSRHSTNSNRDKICAGNYYYPTDWEVQLINNLKIKKLETVAHILNEIRNENNKRNLSDSNMKKLISVIMETMFRVLKELYINNGIYIRQFESKMKNGTNEELWSYIYEVGNLICERMQYSNTASTVELGDRLLQYVNDNYSCTAMSLKKLAEVFHTSESNISKIFKEVTGINFYDYICRMRMEMAKELLREKTYKTNSIANMVGYENAYSFKRAFIRYEGIKPDEYLRFV